MEFLFSFKYLKHNNYQIRLNRDFYGDFKNVGSRNVIEFVDFFFFCKQVIKNDGSLSHKTLENERRSLLTNDIPLINSTRHLPHITTPGCLLSAHFKPIQKDWSTNFSIDIVVIRRKNLAEQKFERKRCFKNDINSRNNKPIHFDTEHFNGMERGSKLKYGKKVHNLSLYIYR